MKGTDTRPMLNYGQDIECYGERDGDSFHKIEILSFKAKTAEKPYNYNMFEVTIHKGIQRIVGFKIPPTSLLLMLNKIVETMLTAIISGGEHIILEPVKYGYKHECYVAIDYTSPAFKLQIIKGTDISEGVVESEFYIRESDMVTLLDGLRDFRTHLLIYCKELGEHELNVANKKLTTILRHNKYSVRCIDLCCMTGIVIMAMNNVISLPYILIFLIIEIITGFGVKRR